MKRSKRIKLVLLSGLSAGALTGCSERTVPQAVSAEAAYTNNFYVQGAGYYHAPFRAWYPLPYNQYDAKSQMYYYGGQWYSTPLANITNISFPTAEAASAAESHRSDLPPPDVTRGGWGGSSRSYSTWS